MHQVCSLFAVSVPIYESDSSRFLKSKCASPQYAEKTWNQQPKKDVAKVLVFNLLAFA